MENFENQPFASNEPDPISDSLLEKNRTLINDYKTPDGNYVESCTLIAVDIAKMLLEKGKRPEIISVTGKQIDNPHIIAKELLKPLPYEGRVSWGAHIVCVCDGLVYDPMIGHILPLEEYTRKAFGTGVDIQVKVTQDKIEEFVNR